MDPAHEALRAKAVEAIEALKADTLRLLDEANSRNEVREAWLYETDAQVYDVAARTIRGRAHK